MLISSGLFAQSGGNSTYFDDYEEPKNNIVFTELFGLAQPTFTLGYAHYFDLENNSINFIVDGGLTYNSPNKDYKFFFLEDEYLINSVEYRPKAPGINFFASAKMIRDMGKFEYGFGLSYKHLSMTTCSINDYMLTVVPYLFRIKYNIFAEIGLGMGLRRIKYNDGVMPPTAWYEETVNPKNMFNANLSLKVGYMF